MVGVRHRIGGYRVIAPIGAGGFATVYRALDEESGRQMAIKVLAENHSLVPDTRRRFEEEMGLLSTVRSPSIAKIYRVGETDAGQPFMVLELADRGDLRRRLEEVRRDHRVLNRADLTILAKHLHDSLRTLHDMEIIHRDVSPGNILIRSHGPDDGTLTGHPAGVTLLEPGEKLLLTDLGHAKDMIIASGFTAGGGTRGFASPEQQEDVAVVDHRADIFAATAVLEWAAVDGEYADGLEPFFDVGLAAEPDDRFDSMAEWYRAFLATIASAEARRAGRHPGRIARLFRRTGAAQQSNPEPNSKPNSGRAEDSPLDLAATGLPPGPGPSPSKDVTPPSPKIAPSPRVVQPPDTPGANGIVRPSHGSGLRLSVPPPAAGGLRIVVKPPSGSDSDVVSETSTASPRDRAEPTPVATPDRLAAATAVRIDGEYVYGGKASNLGGESGDHGGRPRSKRRRRLAMMGGVLTIAAVAAIGLAQELDDSSRFFGSDTTGEDADLEPESVPPAVPMEDQSAVAGLLGQPAELVVTTEPTAPRSAVETPGSPRASITLPVDGTNIVGDLTVQVTAGNLDDSNVVQLSIKNLDTLRYWDADSESFQRASSVLELETGAVGATPEWSTTVPADQLDPGRYFIEVWVEGDGSGVSRQRDSRRVVVP